MKQLFYGGVHPAEHKEATEQKPIQPLAKAPAQVVIPMSMHIGAPCKPTVQKGDTVLVGQMIGATAGLGAPIHASVSGTVVAVEPRPGTGGVPTLSVVIENDFQNTLSPDCKPRENVDALSSQEIIDIIRDAGCTGMGGAGFPTHVKISSGLGKVDYVIINAAECEPYITGDHRTCLERPEQVIKGATLLAKCFGVDKVYIGIEANKQNAADVLNKTIAELNAPVVVEVLHTRYPQGAEKQLVQAVSGRQVPSGKLPADVGCVVSNTSTAKAISDAIQKGMPLVERVVSVTGEFIRNPGNYIVKLGTNVQEIIDHCGGITGDDVVLKMGGPMMGAPIKDTNVPIIKGSNGIIAIAADHTEEKECIKCGRCMDVCPMELAPLDIYKYAQLGDAETLLKLNVMDCFSCKCCEYICSSKIPLVSKINAAKGLVMPLLKKK